MALDGIETGTQRSTGAANLVPALGEIQPADVLIVIPPFAILDRPSLGAHLLQACADVQGHRVKVLYGNLLFARAVGEDTYKMLSMNYQCTEQLLGERCFARGAYESPPLGIPADGSGDEAFQEQMAVLEMDTPLAELRQLEATAYQWADELGQLIADLDIPIVGASTTFEQTAPGLAILKGVKRHRPATTTILGGANCESEMADGILSAVDHVDFVFSGESEDNFVAFLNDYKRAQLPRTSIIRGEPRRDMESLPVPKYHEYFAQKASYLPESEITDERVWLPYESSRGCWWGEKSHCTFCGLNGLGMVFREKSADRVIGDLNALLEDNPSSNIAFSDNIMPNDFFKTLLPRLPDEVPPLRIFYEEKANLNLEKVLLMKEAGVSQFQPGIEALSTPLLRKMGKGVSAAQNIALLRYVASAQISMSWNLLTDFPLDEEDDYRPLLQLIPRLHHLPPPTSLGRLRIDRFSPYFEQPERFDVNNLRPWSSYTDILPSEADAKKVAYYFNADFNCLSKINPGLAEEIYQCVKEWTELWQAEPADRPKLFMRQATSELFVVVDKRLGDDGTKTHFLNARDARIVMSSCKLDKMEGERAEIVTWALDNAIGAEVEGRYVPLPTGEPELLRRIENSYGRNS